ncbi:MAG: hypothetical protein M1411_06225 [Candidatus Thermoplasmatota archaeon]|nr:hypothetical protein [Candidatus Thermoplasmatota archaeon]
MSYSNTQKIKKIIAIIVFFVIISSTYFLILSNFRVGMIPTSHNSNDYSISHFKVSKNMLNTLNTFPDGTNLKNTYMPFIYGNVQQGLSELTAHSNNETAVSYEEFYLDSAGNLANYGQDPVISTAKELGLNAFPMIAEGSDTDVINFVTNSGEWTSFINQAITTAESNGYAGYNIDWEPQGASIPSSFAQDYANFLTTFSNDAHKNGLIITVDIAWYNSEWWNYQDLAKTTVNIFYDMDYYGYFSTFLQSLENDLSYFPISTVGIILQGENPNTNSQFSLSEITERIHALESNKIIHYSFWALGDGSADYPHGVYGAIHDFVYNNSAFESWNVYMGHSPESYAFFSGGWGSNGNPPVNGYPNAGNNNNNITLYLWNSTSIHKSFNVQGYETASRLWSNPLSGVVINYWQYLNNNNLYVLEANLSSTGTIISSGYLPEQFGDYSTTFTYMFTPDTVYGLLFEIRTPGLSSNTGFNNWFANFNIAPLYAVTFTESGLPSGTSWSVTLGSTTKSSTSSTITFYEPDGVYSCSIETPISGGSGVQYITSPSSTSVTVNGGPVNEGVNYQTQYYLTMSENPAGEGSVTPGSGWYTEASSVSISATPYSGYQFLSWSGSGAGSYSGTTNQVSITMNGPVSETANFGSATTTYAVTFTESGLPTGTIWYVNITGGNSYSSTTSTITFSELNGTYSYSIATGNKEYAPSPASGSFTVNGAVVSESITFSLVTYRVTFTESGLPSGTIWYVNITGGASYSSTTSTITFSEPNGTYSYSIATGNKEYAPSPASGSFTVNGAVVSESITFNLFTYSVTFTESGLPTGTTWYVNITGQPSQSSTGTTITVQLPNGTYSYSIATGNKEYAPSPASGSFTVNGAVVSESITFNLFTYSVTFTESGLPTGTNWSVTLNSTIDNARTKNIIFMVLNGSYNYLVGYVAGYVSSPSHGTITVSGKNITETITWAPGASYTVTFNETGLPDRTNWSVSVDGYTKSSVISTIQFMLQNGTYTFTVNTIPNYIATPSTGSLNITGAPINKTIAWRSTSASLYTIKFVESGLPSSTTWYVILSGITGSSSSNTITFEESNGTYTFSIENENYIATPSSGVIAVKGTNVEENITFTISSKYIVEFTERGLPIGSSWSVTLNTIYTESSTNTTVTFSIVNGTYNYTIGRVQGYSAVPSTGQFKVTGAPVKITIDYATVKPVVYMVTFVESGLLGGTTWYVTLNNFNKSGTGSSITFKEVMGSYNYTITTINGYKLTGIQSTGIITVNKNTTENITFVPVSATTGQLGINSFESSAIFVIIIFIILVLLILMFFYREKTIKIAKNYMDKSKSIISKITKNKKVIGDTKPVGKDLTTSHRVNPYDFHRQYISSNVPYSLHQQSVVQPQSSFSTQFHGKNNNIYPDGTFNSRPYVTEGTTTKNKITKTIKCPSCQKEIPVFAYICPVCRNKIVRPRNPPKIHIPVTH